jgi:DNA-binding NarL/FixJ family response regulator
MPEIDGVRFVKEFRMRLPGTSVLFIYGSPDHPLVRSVLARGEAALSKPFLPAALVAAVEALLMTEAPVKGGAGLGR